MNESDRIAAVQQYLIEVTEQFYSGHAIEHAYRPALQRLINSLDDVVAVNDPKHSEHGAPDFVFLKKSNTKVIKGYAEAKDITVSLDKTERSDQMTRYGGYANLILTDYLEFRFFRNGEKYETISVGHVKNGNLYKTPENAQRLIREIEAFLEQTPESIRSGKRLAQIMGGKARRIRDNVAQYLQNDDVESKEFDRIFGMMKQMLVHDLTPERFADMYAQTLVYGLFVARYGDTTPDNFTRSEARDLVPASNPFLRHFFDHIVGPNFDTRLGYIVDELCEIFSVSNVQEIVHKHLKIADEITDAKDPIIHFYEDFLQEYDPAERKKMGAYYTPIPVVKYIIRHVDKILKEEFGIVKGLASTELINQTIETQPWRKKGERKDRTTKDVSVPRVQVLDPAVGTATFLNETIKFIHEGFKGQEGRWPRYVNENLLKRLHGFELMMAPYTIAHLKLGMTLKETGVETPSERLGVYLTNTLEEGIPHQPDLFSFGLAEAVSDESRLAADIKADHPVMVVMGNPPYSGVSSNETKYANALINKYKVEPGGKQKLQERKHWLNDDYVKFIAFAEDMIAKNGTGIVAMITNNGYLENPTFRGMRWHMAQTFDKIYCLDLHGNAKKKETSPDGGKDENVFDIMQGVSIVLAVKTSENTENAQVFHADLYGKRGDKFADLNNAVLQFKQISLDPKMYYFVEKNTEGKEEYDKGIALNELMPINTTGIVTARDSVVIDESRSKLLARIEKFCDFRHSDDEIRQWLFPAKKDGKYKAGDSRGWKLDTARRKIAQNEHESFIQPIAYRPFDNRNIYYSPDMVDWGREKIMRHMLHERSESDTHTHTHTHRGRENIAMIFKRGLNDSSIPPVFVVDCISGHRVYSSAGQESIDYSAPLYVYDATKNTSIAATRQQKTREGFHHLFTTDEISESSLVSNKTGEISSQFPLYILQSDDNRRANFDEERLKQLFSEIEQPDDSMPRVWPEDILDYIYASLHSPRYREKYKEFLKTDFPRVPRPKSWSEFWRLVQLGRELRELHLMHSSQIENYETTFSVHGDGVVETIKYEDGKVFINPTQYFGNVPEVAWSFYIGGYQPAQKWLKDRKGRPLSNQDIDHYQRIVKILLETDRIMREIG